MILYSKVVEGTRINRNEASMAQADARDQLVFFIVPDSLNGRLRNDHRNVSA